MKKRMLTVCLASSLLLLGATTIKVNATSQQETTLSATNLRGMPQLRSNNIDTTHIIKCELANLAYNTTYNRFYAGTISRNELLPYNGNWNSLNVFSMNELLVARVNDDMVVADGEALAAHSATLFNGSGTDQSLKTASFTYTQMDSVTTSSTHTVGISRTVSAKMNFPIGEVTTTMNAKYDFSTTKAVQSTETKQWSVPSQDIKVPAGRTYKVDWVLNTGVATGTSDIASQVKAIVPFKKNPNRNSRFATDIGHVMDMQNDLVKQRPSTPYIWGEQKNWERIDAYTALRKWGTSNYVARFGTQLFMRITDVTNKNKRTSSQPVIIDEIPMNVKPEVIK